MPPARWNQLSPLNHSLLTFVGVGGVYWWLHIPALQPYSLQFFAGLGISYFILKKVSQTHAWHFLPAAMSLETIFAIAALLLLIGATGGTTSWFYPLTYLVLFIVIFSSHIFNSIFTTMIMMLFLYGTSSQLHQHELVAIFSLPIVMTFLIFAKLQHEEAITDRLVIKTEEIKIDELEAEEFQLQNFLTNFLSPKITQLEKFLEFPNNSQSVKTQLHLIKLEIEKLLKQINSNKCE